MKKQKIIVGVLASVMAAYIIFLEEKHFYKKNLVVENYFTNLICLNKRKKLPLSKQR